MARSSALESPRKQRRVADWSLLRRSRGPVRLHGRCRCWWITESRCAPVRHALRCATKQTCAECSRPDTGRRARSCASSALAARSSRFIGWWPLTRGSGATGGPWRSAPALFCTFMPPVLQPLRDHSPVQAPAHVCRDRPAAAGLLRPAAQGDQPERAGDTKVAGGWRTAERDGREPAAARDDHRDGRAKALPAAAEGRGRGEGQEEQEVSAGAEHARALRCCAGAAGAGCVGARPPRRPVSGVATAALQACCCTGDGVVFARRWTVITL